MLALPGPAWLARRLLLATLVLGFGVAATNPPNAAGANISSGCRVPPMAGLTLEKARALARHAGCQLDETGSPLTLAAVQTVARQSPAAGQHATSVTVWVNRLCNGMAAYPPAIKEPRVTSGQTELVTGFFLVGGPLVRFSDPHCQRPAPESEAGKVIVTNASGTVVASQDLAPGHLAKISLTSGTYTVTGTFVDAGFNGVHPKRTEKVVIPKGHTVRQDLFLDVP